MYKPQKFVIFTQLPQVFGLMVLVASMLMPPGAGMASAHALSQAVPASGTANSGSFYYYADGQRIQLTPSLEWVSVNFSGDDPQMQAFTDSPFDAVLGPLDQARQLGLLPRAGTRHLPAQRFNLGMQHLQLLARFLARPGFVI